MPFSFTLFFGLLLPICIFFIKKGLYFCQTYLRLFDYHLIIIKYNILVIIIKQILYLRLSIIPKLNHNLQFIYPIIGGV